MKQKYYLTLSIEEWRLMLVALNTFRNRLISEGKYTDAVDEVWKCQEMCSRETPKI